MKTKKEIETQCEAAMKALLEDKNLDATRKAYIQGQANALSWVLGIMWVD